MNLLNSYGFNNEGSIFMAANRVIENCKIVLYGVPYDGTTSFRPGARFGPSAIREVSNGIETFCPELEIDLEDLNFADIGSLKVNYGDPKPVIDQVEKVTYQLINAGKKPLMLGGEHSITIGAVKASADHFNNLIVIQLDAHADLREEWLGSMYSHACTMRRCLDFLPNKKIFQIGIRSGTRNEFREMKEYNRLIHYGKNQPAQYLANALINYKDNPIYLTIDLDWFDPSVMPGTGTPEPGGYFWNDFSQIINILKEYKIIGADVVELAPQLDNSGISSILAAKVVRSLLMLLSK